MAGTAAARAKRALLDLLDGQPGLEGVTVSYGWAGREQPRECIYGGDATWQTQLLTFAPAGGRNQRREDGEINFFVVVRVPGGTQEDAEARAVEIGTVVEEFLAGNPALGLPDVKLGQILGGRLASDPDDDGITAALAYRVGFMSVLD